MLGGPSPLPVARFFCSDLARRVGSGNVHRHNGQKTPHAVGNNHTSGPLSKVTTISTGDHVPSISLRVHSKGQVISHCIFVAKNFFFEL